MYLPPLGILNNCQNNVIMCYSVIIVFDTEHILLFSNYYLMCNMVFKLDIFSTFFICLIVCRGVIIVGHGTSVAIQPGLWPCYHIQVTALD